MTRTVLTVVAAIVLAATGCSSGHTAAATSAGPATTATVLTTATHTSTTTAAAPTQSASHPATSAKTTSAKTTSAKTTSATTTPSPTSDGACGNGQLRVTSTPASGGDSHGGIVVRFTDTGAACTLFGYPGAAVVNSAGRQIVQASRTLSGYLGGCGCSKPSQVRLTTGASASALIEGDNGGGDECLAGRALLVTPPNTTRSTRIAFQAYSCHVQVHPVKAGSSAGGLR